MALDVNLAFNLCVSVCPRLMVSSLLIAAAAAARDQLSLFNASGSLISSVKWQSSDFGSDPTAALRLAPDGKAYRVIPQTMTLIDLLTQLGDYTTFVDALKV
jgi:hypothetical protein